MITDLQGAIEYVNPEFLRLTSYTAEEVLGKNSRLLSSGLTPPETYPRLWATIKAGGVWRGEFCNRKKNGELYWETAVISPVRSETGEITHFLAVKEDITERKQAALRLEAFSNLGQRLSSAKTVQTAARVIVDAADQLLRWDACGFDLYSPVNDQIHEVLSVDIIDGHRADVPPACEEGSPTPRMRRAIESGGCLILRQGSDGPTDDGILFGDLTRRSASIMLVPIRDGSQTLALLSIQSYTPDAYDDGDLHLLQSLAGFCAGALNRIRAGEALQESESLYHATFDGAPVGIARTGLDGRFLHVNQQFAHMLGYTPDELRNRHFRDITFPDDHHADSEVTQRLLKGEVVTQSREKRYVCKDGRIVWGNRTLNIRRDAAGKPQSFLVAIEDITERKKVGVTLQEQARLLDLATDAIFVRDLEDHVQYWNSGAERMYGWTAAEATGRKVAELLQRDAAVPDTPNQQLLQDGEWAGELRKCRKGGPGLTVYSRWTLVRDDQGRPKSVLAIDTDVTEKKTLEAQFLRAQRLESIGTLASGIAHDLNNILAPIQMAAQLLREESSQAEREKMLDTIATSAERGAGIVRQVLTFARGVEGERVLVQLRHLVRDLAKIMKETFPKNITVRTHAPKDVWPVTSDATQMHQVLLNLCVNARDAMPNGGTLSISLENLSADESYVSMTPEARVGPYVVVEVKDTGTGIPPAVLERIFDPFFTTKPLGSGTGLGLSTALGIVKSHRGFFSVTSLVNQGSTFRVFLPATMTAEAGLGETPMVAAPSGQGELVLVVDDELAIREVTERMLKRNGYTVATAVDGADALAVYSQQLSPVRVVLTDIMMPEMDGPALVRVLRKISPDLPVIASTGVGQGDKIDELQTLGVKLFLRKPYMADDLLRALKDALSPPPA
ncbi:MAG: PAS domain S-box protein [Limisphaerales bacterium]